MRINMMSAIGRVLLAILFLVLMRAPHASACTWAVGYFYQVTALKGRVVGVDAHGAPRWLRQHFAQKQARLALYEYQYPSVAWGDRLLIKKVEADQHGNFEFGPLKNGHYTLVIDGKDLFDVEVKNDLPRATKSVAIDVSPVTPDCKGGHEFTVNTN